MGTIMNRGGRFTAVIRIKRNKRIVHQEARTFERKQAAQAWLRRREVELAEPGALDSGPDPTLGAVIDRYIAESVKTMGPTKAQVLRTIKTYDIADRACSRIGSADISKLAAQLAARGIGPATVGSYLSHLSAVFAVARPLWGYPLRQDAMRDAQTALRKLGTIAASKQRTRRPSLDELDKLLTHFARVESARQATNRMTKVIGFAIFSTRRQGEIVRIRWDDLDEAGSRVLVRDMKHPERKSGNDTWVELPPEALAIVKSMPRVDERIFPYTEDAISTAFTRACKFLEIEDLDFHDLRHHGISRLFEMGRTIPLAAQVSGHRSWQSLQRYSHIRQTGDCLAGWPWLAVLVNGDGAPGVDPVSKVNQVDAARGLL